MVEESSWEQQKMEFFKWITDQVILRRIIDKLTLHTAQEVWEEQIPKLTNKSI